MARNKTSKAWMHEHVTDLYVQQAKRMGYRSRAAFKLKELSQRDQLIRPGMTVVDLGATPGGWSQVAAELVGPKGRVIAVDMLEMDAVPGVQFIQGDFGEPEALQQVESALGGRLVDLVVCDMAPNISGIRRVGSGSGRSSGGAGSGVCGQMVEAGGKSAGQNVSGHGFSGTAREYAATFPPGADAQAGASRSRSSEIYLLAKDLVRKQGLERTRITAIRSHQSNNEAVNQGQASPAALQCW